jgi:hypothetical protein
LEEWIFAVRLNPQSCAASSRMAFGQKDRINAQRVDRIEHNDNIDTRIILEIEAADLVNDKFCDGLPFDRQECMT